MTKNFNSILIIIFLFFYKRVEKKRHFCHQCLRALIYQRFCGDKIGNKNVTGDKKLSPYFQIGQKRKSRGWIDAEKTSPQPFLSPILSPILSPKNEIPSCCFTAFFPPPAAATRSVRFLLSRKSRSFSRNALPAGSPAKAVLFPEMRCLRVPPVDGKPDRHALRS